MSTVPGVIYIERLWTNDEDVEMMYVNIFLPPRETPDESKRVILVFNKHMERHKGELAELELQESMVNKEKPVSLV